MFAGFTAEEERAGDRPESPTEVPWTRAPRVTSDPLPTSQLGVL